MKIMKIRLATIGISPKLRAINDKAVDALAESISRIGLLQPIGITADKQLIYGRRRVAACLQLGHEMIPAVILDLDDMEAKLAEIDENLIRSPLSKAERIKALQRRKEIYEAMHPETKKPKGGRPKKNSAETAPFSEDTAKATGKSKRSVQADVALSKKLDDEAVKIIADTPVANKKTELAKLAALSPDDQRDIAQQIVDEKLDRVPVCPKCGGSEFYDDGDCRPCFDLDAEGELLSKEDVAEMEGAAAREKPDEPQPAKKTPLLAQIEALMIEYLGQGDGRKTRAVRAAEIENLLEANR
jgi:ParB family chromosome partitioning protein